MTITATLAGAISMLAQFGMFFSGGHRNNNGFGIIGTLAMVILAPIAAMLVQMAISRTREYSADKMGAMILGSPTPLMTGLVKIENAAHQIENPSAEQNPATAHMFIINPLTGGHGWDNLFATHPSTQNRIAALQQLAGRDGREHQYRRKGKRAEPVRSAAGRWREPLGHPPRRSLGLKEVAKPSGCEFDSVMPGLVPGIHVLAPRFRKDVDGRAKPGHDLEGCRSS